MKPLRHPLVAGPGCRTPQTLLLIDERDALLREAARFFPGLSHREVARRLRSALSIYRNGRWQRDCSEATCPIQHRDKLTAILWGILKTRDALVSDRTIRRALAVAPTHGPAFEV